MARLHSATAIMGSGHINSHTIVHQIRARASSQFFYVMHPRPMPTPTDQGEELALLVGTEALGTPVERGGPGYNWSRWPLVLGVILALGALWSAGNGSGAWPKHKAPAAVAQQTAVIKEGGIADAISTGLEGMAAVISSAVTLATSVSGPLENDENRKAIGDTLEGCGKTCLAVTAVATAESAGTAIPAEGACVPLIVAGSAISAFNDISASNDGGPTTKDLSDKMNMKDLSDKMNMRFDQLSDQIDEGFDSLTNKLEGFVRDINEDQASKQSETLSKVNDHYHEMWVHIHADALTEESLPSHTRLVDFRASFHPKALREYLQNVWLSGALIPDVLQTAVGFVAARSQLFTMELLRCALDGHGTCQPDLTADLTKELDDDLRGYEPIMQQWGCHHAVLAAGRKYVTGEEYLLCLPPSVTRVDLSGTSVVGELKDLPPSVTTVDVGDTSVGGELKDLPPSVTYVNVWSTSVVGELKDLPPSVTDVHVAETSVGGELKDLPPSVTYVDVSETSVGGELKDLPPSVTIVVVSETSVGGELKDLPPSVTIVDVAETSVGGELKDLPPSVTYVDVSETSVGGELKDLPSSVTYVDVSETSVGGELKDLPSSVTYVDVSETSVGGELKDLPSSVTIVDVSGTSVGGELKDLPSSVTYVDVRSTSVVGDFEDLPASVTCAFDPSGASRC